MLNSIFSFDLLSSESSSSRQIEILIFSINKAWNKKNHVPHDLKFLVSIFENCVIFIWNSLVSVIRVLVCPSVRRITMGYLHDNNDISQTEISLTFGKEGELLKANNMVVHTYATLAYGTFMSGHWPHKTTCLTWKKWKPFSLILLRIFPCAPKHVYKRPCPSVSLSVSHLLEDRR